MKSVIDIRIKRMTEGTFRKFTKEEMVEILIRDHPELINEVFDKSYFIDDLREAANFLTDAFIDESLDITTLESDAERKKRLPPEPEDDNQSLWDKISENI